MASKNVRIDFCAHKTELDGESENHNKKNHGVKIMISTRPNRLKYFFDALEITLYFNFFRVELIKFE